MEVSKLIAKTGLITVFSFQEIEAVVFSAATLAPFFRDNLLLGLLVDADRRLRCRLFVVFEQRLRDTFCNLFLLSDFSRLLLSLFAGFRETYQSTVIRL